ncbi:hypothetical protein CSC14_2106 [Proteus mirabilis]|nr:hypothetical protein CSC14_2106 [Proteus mirabilis]
MYLFLYKQNEWGIFLICFFFLIKFKVLIEKIKKVKFKL